MSTTSGVRYSQGDKDIGAAKNFRWEYPVPANNFWNDLSFVVGRNFLQSFTPDEIERLPIDPNSTQDKTTKLKLLLKLLHAKLEAEDAAAAPQTYYNVNFEGWSTLWLGIFTMQDELGDPDSEQTIRMMIDRRQNKANLSHLHTLSGILLRQGKYAEAEETEIPVRNWLDGRLGRDSPQALGSRRMIAQAVWKQGPQRQTEARQLFSELMGIIDGMGGSQYAVYQEEQKEITEKVVTDLEKEVAPQ